MGGGKSREHEGSPAPSPENSSQGFGYDTYLSPYTYRYGTDAMRGIWSEHHRWLTIRNIWIATAEVQMQAGLVKQEEYDDLVAHREDVDIQEIMDRELIRDHPRFTGHDIVAGISVYADQAPVGARIIHQGLTSEDVLSNAEVLLTSEALDVVENRIKAVLDSFAGQIDAHKDLVVLGYTHLQAAEPTTLGYRLARYAQDFLVDLRSLNYLRSELRGKGIKCPVGTSASFERLLEGTGMTSEEHEQRIMDRLGIPAATITGQTYPRKLTLMTISTLAGIAMSAHQFANDMKLMQSSHFDKIAEPRRRSQVGSSAMPHKINPNTVEGIKGLARSLPGKVVEAWINASEVTLERGLEDSSGKRSYLPESFLTLDDILQRTARVVRGMDVFEGPLQRNLDRFGSFVVLEAVLADATRNGADRQQTHEVLRELAFAARDAIRRGEANPLQELVRRHVDITIFVPSDRVDTLFDSVVEHVGNAPQKCVDFLEKELYPVIRI